MEFFKGDIVWHLYEGKSVQRIVNGFIHQNDKLLIITETNNNVKIDTDDSFRLIQRGGQII